MLRKFVNDSRTVQCLDQDLFLFEIYNKSINAYRNLCINICQEYAHKYYELLLMLCMFFTVVTITTQPSDVAVPSGGTAMFTCVVNLRRQIVTINNARWNDNMGNTITLASTDPYIVDNDFEIVDLDVYLTSTLTITNVNTQHAGVYQFVLSLNDGDMMSREAFLSVLKGIGIKILYCICFLQVIMLMSA